MPARPFVDGTVLSAGHVRRLEKAIAAYESDLYRPALNVFDNAAQRDFRIVEGR